MKIIYADSGQDEGIHMPKGQRDGHSTLAKSLPVTVPAFPSMMRRRVQDQDDDQVKFHTFKNVIVYTIQALSSLCSDFIFYLIDILSVFFGYGTISVHSMCYKKII